MENKKELLIQPKNEQIYTINVTITNNAGNETIPYWILTEDLENEYGFYYDMYTNYAKYSNSILVNSGETKTFSIEINESKNEVFAIHSNGAFDVGFKESRTGICESFTNTTAGFCHMYYNFESNIDITLVRSYLQ